MRHSTWKIAFCILLTAALTNTAAFAGHHEKGKDIVETAVGAGSFKTLVAAVQAAGLVEALQGDGPFTVFAPTDEAFAKLPEGTVESLLEPENLGRLKDILTYHVVAGKVSARKAAGIDRATTLNGQKVAINIQDGRLKVDESNVVTNDIDCSNGVIHVIDRVLIPEETMRSTATNPRELIKLAISRGAPLYNDGQAKACAAVYEVTAQSLLYGYSDKLSDSSKKRLSRALDEIDDVSSSDRQAWILRRALDDVYAASGHSGSRNMSSR